MNTGRSRDGVRTASRENETTHKGGANADRRRRAYAGDKRAEMGGAKTREGTGGNRAQVNLNFTRIV